MKYSKLKLKNAKKIDKIYQKKQQEVQEIFNASLKIKDKIINTQPFIGTGLIVTSGRTVQGHQTKFKQQVQKGDFIILQNLLLKTVQQKCVTLVFGDKSILLDDQFIQQFSTFTSYKIRKKSKIQKGQDLTQNYKQKLEEIKNQKTKGIKKSTMDVRVKKGVWSYTKKKVQVDGNLSKEQLLDIREKMGKDKFCW